MFMRIPCLVATCRCVLILASAAAAGQTPAETAIVVNGLRVPREEVAWFLGQERAGVIQFCKQKHALDFGAGFWDRKCGGTTPRALLQARTRERIVQEKVGQMLFKELGLIQDASYAAFLDELENTNRERASAKAQGRIIYGPVSYTQLQYFGHSKATRQLQAKEILGRDRLVASETELRAAYEQNRKVYTSAAVSSWEIITLQSAGNADGPEVGKQIATGAKRIQSRLKSGTSAQQAVDELQGNGQLVIAAGQLSGVDAGRLAEMFSDRGTFEKMRKLKPGCVVSIPASAGVTRVVKCISRTPGELQAFEKVRTQVQKQILQHRYEAFISELATKADVRVDQTQIDLIPIE